MQQNGRHCYSLFPNTCGKTIILTDKTLPVLPHLLCP